MATVEATTTTPNKITAGYIASEIWCALKGLEILREYVAEGGDQDQKNWLCETVLIAFREAYEHAEALADATHEAAE